MQSVIKSRNDKLLYRVVELPSSMRCVLISDAETENSAAVVAVNVGSIQDPKTHEGLAHFLEHMLFMGSASYPDAAGYFNFITQAGGHSNAFTAMTETCYYFNIPNPKFSTALDMFAEFFVSPLLRPDNVDKEMQAVNSEHEKNLLNDRWREEQLLKALADPSSVYCKAFSTGSLATLQRPDVHQQVRDFYHATYSANLMALVLYSNGSLDELEQLARAKFAQVPDKSVQKPLFAARPFFTRAQLGRLVKLKSVNKEHRLELRFFFRSLEADFRQKPLEIVNHLLGHESEGSILAQLIAEKLAHALYVQQDHLADANSLIILTVQLTPLGFQSVERVLMVIGQYVRNLGREVPQWVFDEYKLISQIKFDFMNKKQETIQAMHIALSMLKFPVEHVLSHDYYLEGYEPGVYAEVLEGLRLENALVILASDEFEGLPLREEIYGTNYSVEPLSPHLIEHFADPQLDVSDRLHLPPRNFFIPQRFELKTGADMPRPQRLAVPGRSENGELFFQKSTGFGLPRAQITYQFTTRQAHEASSAAVELCGEIWCKLLEERLKKYTYLAEMADLRFSLNSNSQGIRICVRGFDDSAARFFKEFGRRISSFSDLATSPDELRIDFENKKTQLKQEYVEKLNGDLFRYAILARNWVLETGSRPFSALLQELDKLDFDEYLAFHALHLKHFHFEAFISGNMLPEEALRLHQEFFDSLGVAQAQPLDPLNTAQIRVPALQVGRTFVLHSPAPLPADTNNCALIAFQGVQDESRRFLMQFAVKLLASHFFDELRTNQQLGYVVLTTEVVHRGVLHFFFLVQSGVVVSHEIARRVYAQLDTMRGHVHDLPAADFEQAREGLIAELSQPFFNLQKQHDHLYDEIRKHSYNFDWREKAVEQLRGLSQVAFNDFFERLFFNERKVLELHFSAARDSEANEKMARERTRDDKSLHPLADERVLQSLLPLYPDVYAKLAA